MLDEITPEMLAGVRLDNARECLRDAEMAFAGGSLKNAANRSYYCIFHSIRALLALDRFDSKKHSGVISEFQRRYIKAKIFPAQLSDIVRDAFSFRNDSDYQDFYIVSKDDVNAQIADAKMFLAAVEKYITKKIPLP
jgi:uncharacterized protein (UPF0332 family)